eukprot:1176770-Pyramimonas_sp.AAC.1
MLSIYARNSGCRRATKLVKKTVEKHGGRPAVASRGSSTSPPAVRKVDDGLSPAPSAGGYRNRFDDIRRVCLSNPELGTRSAART